MVNTVTKRIIKTFEKVSRLPSLSDLLQFGHDHRGPKYNEHNVCRKKRKKMLKLSDSCGDKCSDSCGKMLFATAKNTTEVLQFVNSTSLLQLANRLQ